VAYAVGLADSVGARRLALFPHGPSRTDAEIGGFVAAAKGRPVDIVAAAEGMTIDL
jgi:hypothetical protein